MVQHKQRFDQLSVVELSDKANTFMANEAYKDAIAVYKQLLKIEPDSGWQARLATAYLRRAKALATKAMYKEAALLWENMAALEPDTDSQTLYIDWLIKAQQFDKAVAIFNHLTPDAPDYQQTSSLFAALLLAGLPAVTQKLPGDSLLRQQLIPAQAALRDYCQGAAPDQVRERLKNISFRSAYRDLRQILNALLKQEDNAPHQALQLLDRIAADSPFAGLAEAVEAQLVREYGWLEKVKTLTPAQRDFVSACLGLDKQQTRLLQQWLKRARIGSDKDLLGFIIQHQTVLDKQQARSSALDVLSRYPQGRKSFEKSFGSLTAFEKAHSAALRAQHEDDLAAMERNWIQCAELLRADTSNPDASLSAALIQRHIVEHLLMARPELRDFPSPGLIQNVELGLRLDPDDKDAYLLLIELHKNALNRKDYQQWVDRALARFPDDNDVLQVAITAAKQKSAFKKAAGLAQRLLERDPINSQARSMLIDAHLAHARKSMINGKFHLAEKELLSAEQVQQRDKSDGRLAIMRGFLAFCQAQDVQAEEYFRAGVALIGDRLSAGLMLWVEAERLRLSPPGFQKYLETLGPQRSSPQMMAMFVRLLNGYLDQNLALQAALDAVSDTLKEAAKALTNEKDMQALLESLKRVPHFRLLADCATSALKHQAQKPLWIYYQIYGRAKGRLHRVSDRDFDRLERAVEQASEDRDQSTVHLIDDFLEQELGILPGPGGQLPSSPDAPLPPTPELTEILKILEQIQHLPKPAREQLLREMTDNLGEPPPEVLEFFNSSPDDDDDEVFDLFDPGFLPAPQPSKRSSKRHKSKRKKKGKKRR